MEVISFVADGVCDGMALIEGEGVVGAGSEMVGSCVCPSVETGLVVDWGVLVGSAPEGNLIPADNNPIANRIRVGRSHA